MRVVSLLLLRRDRTAFRCFAAGDGIGDDAEDFEHQVGAIEGGVTSRIVDIVAWTEFLRRSQAIAKPLEPTRCYTTALVDGFNDFDEDAVRAQANSMAL